MESKFIPNRPLGQDLFDGQSQNRVAEAVKKHVLSVDAKKDVDKKELLPRIIGVEGTWGAGKSNMLKQLEEKLKDHYLFFTYDAWGNQEDLQRRSILELLTDKLIKEEKLVKDTTINVLNTDLDKEPTPLPCSWKRRLFTLVSRKSATHTVTIPKIENSTKWFALSLLFAGLMAAIVSSIQFVECGIVNFFIIFALSMLPVFAFCILRYCKYKQQLEGKKEIRGWSWKEMWQMYQTEGTQDTTTYTVSELEPSVSEFREWMKDLSDSLAEDTKLVIVFDNMDRLPREKVRQLWSTIHTFFADKGYDKVWCIIPFDREHLANAFANDLEDDSEKLTNYFIEKTFPIVYRIPEPIITDYKGVFKTLFVKAFGEREEQQIINRCYRLKNPIPNMREMISFINKCVSLKHTWGEDIRLTSIAIFVLNYDILFNKQKTPEDVILDGDYLDSIYGVVEMDEELPVEISALVYGVIKEEAAQLPLKNLVNKAFSSDAPSAFDKYAKEQKTFFSILEDEIADLDPVRLDNAINHISEIQKEEMTHDNQDKLDDIWNVLGGMYLKKTQNETSFRNEVMLLMSNCSGKSFKEKIGKEFIERFADDDKNEHKGNEWYWVYKEFDGFLHENGLEVELPEKKMNASDFQTYVETSREEYDSYPITCENGDLNKDALRRVKEGIDVTSVLHTLKGNKEYDFSELFAAAKSLIEGGSATDGNISAVLSACKALSTGPLNLKVNPTYLDQLTHEGDAKYDVQLLRALEGREIDGKDEDYYVSMAKLAYNYTTTSEIWDKTLSIGTQVLSNIMKWIIIDDNHTDEPTAIDDMITSMSKMVDRTSVSKAAIIKFINDWGRSDLNSTEKNLSLQNILVGEDWCRVLLTVKNEFAKALLKKYYRDFNAQQINAFFNANNSWMPVQNSYWLRQLKVLVEDADFMDSCKEKVTEINSHLVEGICAGHITKGNNHMDLQQRLLNSVKFDNVSSKVNEMMVRFGNGQYVMDKYKFLSLHHYLEQTKGYETQMLNYVLKPIINDAEVQKIILGNAAYYEPLIHDNIVQASDLKNEMLRIYESTTDSEMKKFIEEVGIIEEKGEEDENENT